MTNVKEQFLGLTMCTDNFMEIIGSVFLRPNRLLKTTFSEKTIFPVDGIIWLNFSRITEYSKPQ